MEIERKHHTEALQQMQAEEIGTDKELIRMLGKIDKSMKRHPHIPNAGKQKWFEGLTKRVLAFAKACDLDVKMRKRISCMELFNLKPVILSCHGGNRQSFAHSGPIFVGKVTLESVIVRKFSG